LSCISELIFLPCWNLFGLIELIVFVVDPSLAFPGGVLAINYLGNVQTTNFGISYQIVNITGNEIGNTIQYRSITGNVNWLKGKA